MLNQTKIKTIAKKFGKKIIPFSLYKYIQKKILSYQYVRDFSRFQKLSTNRTDFKLLLKNRKMTLCDKTRETNFDAHYIYHPAWAARIIKKINPVEHVDISSTLHFCSILSAFIPVRFYDYRLANVQLSGLISEKADLTNLPFKDNSIPSLSCMHTVEHIGLGRYGDTLDPSGDLKAIAELKRVLTMGGNLLFVVPIGKPKICFNAHRIYSYEQILKYFDGLTLMQFSLIPDNAIRSGIIINATKEQSDVQNYGCGCFWFVKK